MVIGHRGVKHRTRMLFAPLDTFPEAVRSPFHQGDRRRKRRVVEVEMTRRVRANGHRQRVDDPMGSGGRLRLAGSAPSMDGCPAWIRTMTRASKELCATLTPPDNFGGKLPGRTGGSKGKSRHPTSTGPFGTGIDTRAATAGSRMKLAVIGGGWKRGNNSPSGPKNCPRHVR